MADIFVVVNPIPENTVNVIVNPIQEPDVRVIVVSGGSGDPVPLPQFANEFFAADGITNQFILNQLPTSIISIDVNGLVELTTEYILVGSIITLTYTPLINDIVNITYTI